jgi:aspartyl-tRNA(Asn)/glutamyl-tRNA(Gln) amidotransferase subunit C
MSVTRETVAKIASLARIRMDEPELDRMVPELNSILGWIEQLGEVDCTGVEPMTAVITQALRLREDGVDADPLTVGGIRVEVLEIAEVAEHGFFGVHKVLE